jgi:hypothetical protein
MASIARSYGCTPPAIRYIVGREQMQPQNDAAQSLATTVVGSSAHLRAGAGDPGHDSASLRRNSRLSASVQAQDASGTRQLPGILDPALYERVTSDIAAFLVAYEAAVADPSAEHGDILREAADRLMRAAARTRIEIERYLAEGCLPPEGKPRLAQSS